MSLPSDKAPKDLIRELHELIKDSRQATRELQEARAQLRQDIRAVAEGVAGAYVNALDALMKKHLTEITEAIDTANAGIVERAAVLAELNTPQEFVETVVHGMLPDVIAALRESLDRAASDAADDMRRQAAVGRQPLKKKGQKLPPAVIVVHRRHGGGHG